MVRKNKRSMKESYSDIDYSNVWDAYDVAMGYLGAEGLCEALAKAMGTDELESNLEYIFRVYDIPFGDDEEEIDEGCHGRKSKKRKSKKNEDLSDDLICRTCSNFKVEQTDTGTWVVKADSKRFGKQAIVFEGSSRREALNWMYKHIQPTKESVRRKLVEKYSDFISKDDAIYAEGTFVDFAKSVKRYIKSEQMKGRFNGWDVEYYFVPEIDNGTKEIRNDSFALVFTKNKKNMFYIETFMQPKYFTTTLTCPILGIKDEPVAHCDGNSDELFYNGGFNSHDGFGSMLSNYVRPTMKDVDTELGTFYESKRVRSKRIVKENSDYATRKKIASNIASWAFGSFNMNDIDDNIDFLINRWFKSKSESFKSRMYMSETYEELAYVLADCDLNTLKSVERGLCIDDDSIAIERDYLDSFNESKITEMTIEQR